MSELMHKHERIQMYAPTFNAEEATIIWELFLVKLFDYVPFKVLVLCLFRVSDHN